jgi:uncharacterized protein DUF6788
MNADFLAQRTQILQQMATLQTMEQGSLKAEFRDSPSGERCGPYFKHQVWQDGSNLSRRVPPQEASALEAAIANRQRFESLATQFVDLTVSHTRQSQPALSLKKKTSRPISSLPKKKKSSS